ncbi:MAG TPA: hypothetical protein VEI53_12735, partial [Ktedonobacteraceae bacterium]|nr:hypothetical protein [Ktedonobacteraceae bacterium]
MQTRVAAGPFHAVFYQLLHSSYTPAKFHKLYAGTMSSQLLEVDFHEESPQDTPIAVIDCSTYSLKP